MHDRLNRFGAGLCRAFARDRVWSQCRRGVTMTQARPIRSAPELTVVVSREANAALRAAARERGARCWRTRGSEEERLMVFVWMAECACIGLGTVSVSLVIFFVPVAFVIEATGFGRISGSWQ